VAYIGRDDFHVVPVRFRFKNGTPWKSSLPATFNHARDPATRFYAIFAFERHRIFLFSAGMIGTILNAAGILIGGVIGLCRTRPLRLSTESYFKVVLGAFTVFYGLRLTWISVSGSFSEVIKQLVVVILALMLGRLAGRALHLQKISNRIGQRARESISEARPDDPQRFSKGFQTCAALFCAAPLGILGSVQEGLSLSQYFYPLGIKAVMDGLAAIGFVSLFGRGVLLSALPVLAFQGTLTLLVARVLEPILSLHNLVNSVNAVGGMLVFCVALVILGLKRIELADYLPSLLVAPLITLVLH
jgi:hypothetical protein